MLIKLYKVRPCGGEVAVLDLHSWVIMTLEPAGFSHFDKGKEFIGASFKVAIGRAQHMARRATRSIGSREGKVEEVFKFVVCLVLFDEIFLH